MANIELFRAKSREELIAQVSDVSNILGESITPPAYSDIIRLPIEDLKEKFPVRYKAYIDTLRRQKRNEAPNYTLHGRTLHALNTLDRYIEKHHSNENGRTLRDYQMNVFEDLREYLERGGTEGYIKLPTGSGKTVLFAEFTEATDHRTLIVVPTKLLVVQTDNMFKQFAEDTETGTLYGDRKEYDRQVTITTYASFMQKIEEEKINPEDYELLILDEAHKALSNRRSTLTRMFAHAKKLGFTATPKYTEDKQLKNLLSTEIHHMGIREAVELGVLSPLSVYIARTDVNLSDVRIHSSGDYVERDLERKINITRRNLGAVDLYKQMFAGQSAISYCVGINHAKELTRLFNQHGVPADFISGEDSQLVQQKKLEKFRNGEVKVLCNADILVEGFDEPRTTVCLNLRPTLSPIIAEQRAGRVLRLDPNNLEKHAYIVDFIDGDVVSGSHIAVSFAQIIEAAQLFRKTAWTSESHEGFGFSRYPELEIEGLKVITYAEEILRLVYEMEDKSEEGWSSYTALSRRFRIAESTVADIVNSLREEQKDKIKEIPSKQNQKAITYVAPDLADMFGNLIKSLRRPDGWTTYHTVAQELDRGITIVIKTVERYRKAHPDWFRRYIGDGGHFNEHYSPELAAALRNELGIRHTVPEGWVTRTALAIALERSQKFIKRLAEQYRMEHPEWFQMREAKKGGSFEHYSPELAEAIRKQAESTPIHAENWVTPNGLGRDLRRKAERIMALAKEVSKEHPEWIWTEIINNKRWERYSPELENLIRQAAGVNEKPPEGWFTATEAVKILGQKDPNFVRKHTERYRKEHPEWFHDYQGYSRVSEHFSQALIQVLKDELATYTSPPEGWITNLALYRKTKKTYKELLSIAEEYRSDHPEWFGEFLNTGGQLFKYYSPELIEEIMKRISNS